MNHRLSLQSLLSIHNNSEIGECNREYAPRNRSLTYGETESDNLIENLANNRQNVLHNKKPTKPREK